MIEVIGWFCVAWTAYEVLSLVLRTTKPQSRQLRAWDSQGRPVRAEVIQ